MDNALSTYWYMLGKDVPGKVWWDAAPTHPAVYRALKVNPGEFAAIYACAPFRVARPDGAPVILAAHPAPKLFDDPDPDWLGIATVIAWDPRSDAASVLGDDAPQVVGRLTEETNVIFASPRAFFQHWARRRAGYIMSRRTAAAQRWNKPPAEADETPGVLMIGAPTEIRWRPSEMPSDIQCQGVNPKVINSALLKAAHVPRARSA